MGGVRSTPMTASTAGSCSSAWASRDPQDVESPVTRMRREVTAQPSQTDRRSASMSRSSSWIEARTSWAIDWTRALSSHGSSGRGRPSAPAGGSGCGTSRAGRPAAEHAQVRERRRDRDVEQPGQALDQPELGEGRHRLLGADDGDRDDRGAGPHRGLDEPAAAEAAQAVAVAVELLGPLAALREHEHELLLVEEQAVDVGRVGRDRADLREEHREARVAAEEVLDGQVQRPRAGVLLLDRLGDHRRVGRQRARVVGDEQGAAGGGHVLDALDLDPEPEAVEELVDRRVQQPLDALGAPPVGDRPLGLDAREERAQVARGDLPADGRAPVGH